RDHAEPVLGVILAPVATGRDQEAAAGAVQQALRDAPGRDRADVRAVRRAEHEKVGLTLLRQRLEGAGRGTLLDLGDLELPAVPLDDAVGQHERVLSTVVLLVSGDDLPGDRSVRHGPWSLRPAACRSTGAPFVVGLR